MNDAPDASHDPPTVLITGATTGIGAIAAERLADRDWNVLVHGRNRDRGEQLATQIRNDGNQATFLRADFADRAGVHALADDVRTHTDALDALVLNAGLSRSECRESWDGVEETFAVNQLAPYLLAHVLQDLLSTAQPSRIVVTSSAIHTRGDLPLDETDTGSADETDPARAATPALDTGQFACTGDYEAFDSYARSKFANLCFAVELAERYADVEADVSVNSFHPGFVPGSGLYRDVGLLFRGFITLSASLPFVGTTVAEGADPIIHLVDETDEDTTGTYFDGTDPADPDSRVKDPHRRTAIWNACADLVGVDPDWP